MRIGIFISDTGGERTGIAELLDAAQWAEASNLSTAWVPHIPWSLDALTALALAGRTTSTIELGTAVVPTYPRHPLAPRSRRCRHRPRAAAGSCSASGRRTRSSSRACTD